MVSRRCLAGRSCGGGQFVGGATRERGETALDRAATPVPSPGGVFDRSEVVGRRAPTPARDATPPRQFSPLIAAPDPFEP